MSEAYWSIINNEWKKLENQDDPAEIKIKERYLCRWENCWDKYEKIFWEVQLGRIENCQWWINQNKKYSCPNAIEETMKNVKGFRDCHEKSWKSEYLELMAESPLLPKE